VSFRRYHAMQVQGFADVELSIGEPAGRNSAGAGDLASWKSTLALSRTHRVIGWLYVLAAALDPDQQLLVPNGAALRGGG